MNRSPHPGGKPAAADHPSPIAKPFSNPVCISHILSSVSGVVVEVLVELLEEVVVDVVEIVMVDELLVVVVVEDVVVVVTVDVVVVVVVGSHSY